MSIDQLEAVSHFYKHEEQVLCECPRLLNETHCHFFTAALHFQTLQSGH